MKKSKIRDKNQKNIKNKLAPVLDVSTVVIREDEREFRNILKKLESIYRVLLRVRTEKEIEKEIRKREMRKMEDEQRKFRKLVESMHKLGVPGALFT